MATLPLITEPTSAEEPSCHSASDGVIDDATAQDLAKVFKALGDPARVKLFLLITASSKGEVCACDLTEPVGLSQSTVSHHMKVLVEAGLVSREQRGRWAHYRPTAGALVTATKNLTA